MGFRKAKALQAALKISIYGESGSGKTLSTLMFAEGLAKATGKKIAFVDTEHGSDFFTMDIPEREVHPKAFDFDAIYTKSLTETRDVLYGMSPSEYSVIVLDSITHIWEAAQNAYTGKTVGNGNIPIQAWSKIKKPYKDLINWLMNCPFHVFILGREGKDFEQLGGGQMQQVGTKMKAEGETAYEPHICLRMAPQKRKNGPTTYAIETIKDRIGVLSGKTILNPTFDNVIKPLMGYLGLEQAQIPSIDDTTLIDLEKLNEQDAAKAKTSSVLRRTFLGKITLANTAEELTGVGKGITPEHKKKMIKDDLDAVREAYKQRELEVK